jgi:hypothetical protein
VFLSSKPLAAEHGRQSQASFEKREFFDANNRHEKAERGMEHTAQSAQLFKIVEAAQNS